MAVGVLVCYVKEMQSSRVSAGRRHRGEHRQFERMSQGSVEISDSPSRE